MEQTIVVETNLFLSGDLDLDPAQLGTRRLGLRTISFFFSCAGTMPDSASRSENAFEKAFRK